MVPPPSAPAGAAAAAASSVAGASAPANKGLKLGRSIPLYSPADQEHLSPLVCLMRSQLELFSATPADVAERAAIGGISQQITAGRVGIRCVHCKTWTPGKAHAAPGAQQQQQQQQQQAKGSTSYPTSLRILHQAVRNWQRYHFSACQHIPQPARDEFARLTSGKRQVSSKASQAYWIQRGLDMGLVDVAAESAGKQMVAGSTSEDEEGGGIYFKDDAQRLGLSIMAAPSKGISKKRTSLSNSRRTSGSSSGNSRPTKKSKATTENQNSSAAAPPPSNPNVSVEHHQQQPAGLSAQVQMMTGTSTLEALLGSIISASSQGQNMAITLPSPMPAPAPASTASSTPSLDGNLLNIPTHTAEDERRELASLSLAELAEIQSDVNGLSRASFNLNSVNLPLALATLDQEMSNLPATETAAYHRAAELCPDQVGYGRKLIFLEHETGDARLAAKTMAGYWTHRVQLFGPDKAFLPMTLTGAMKEEVFHMSHRRLWEMGPVPDTAGRPILYHTPCRRDFSQYSFEQEMRAMWYLFESVIEDPNSRKNGVVILADLRGYAIRHYTLKIATLFSPLLSVLPTQVRAVHCCYPNPIVNALMPLSKKFLRKRLRLRLVVHQPPPFALLASLNRYCIPSDRIPTDLGVGGSVVLNTSSWMLSRMALENSRQDSNLASSMTIAPAPAGVAAAASSLLLEQASAIQPPSIVQLASLASSKQPGPTNYVADPPPVDKSTSAQVPESSMSKKSLIMKRMESPDESRPCPTKFSHLNDRELYEQIMKERRRTGVGRKADPRMDEAVLACLADSKLSRMDALSSSGFNFSGSDVRDSHNPIDDEGIAFQQRRDQLNRRLRQAQGYIKAARNDSQKNEFEDSAEEAKGRSNDAAESLVLMARNTPSPTEAKAPAK